MLKSAFTGLIFVFFFLSADGQPDHQSHWVDSLYQSLSISEQLSQLIWVEESSAPDVLHSLDDHTFRIQRIEDLVNIGQSGLAAATVKSIADSIVLYQYGVKNALVLRNDKKINAILYSGENAPSLKEGVESVITILDSAEVENFQHFSERIEDFQKFKKQLLRRKVSIPSIVIADNTSANLALEQFFSGTDMFITTKAQSLPIYDELRFAVREKRKYRDLLEMKVKKILSFKYTALFSKNARYDASSNFQDKRLLEAAIVCVKNKNLPIADLYNKSIAVYSRDASLHRHVNRYLRSVFTSDTSELRTLAVDADYLIIDYDPSISENYIRSLPNEKSVFIVQGNPDPLMDLNEMSNVIWSNDTTDTSSDLIAQVIFGARSATGIVPFDISQRLGIARGVNVMHINRIRYGRPEDVNASTVHLKKIDSILHEAVLNRATPGGQVLVASKGQVIYNKSFGFQTYDSLYAVNEQTLYDLASVTKVMATTVQLMKLYEDNKIQLEDSIGMHVSGELKVRKGNLKIKDILLHQAGLKSYQPFWKLFIDDKEEKFLTSANQTGSIQIHKNLYAKKMLRDSVYQWLSESPLSDLRNNIGNYRYSYSDLGFILLNHVIESQYETRLDVLSNRFFYAPLAMNTTHFQPWKYCSVQNIAPTEVDTHFRGELIRGWVHDRNASLLEGVSGHAGLFSTSNDLVKIAQMLLNGGSYGAKQYFHPETIALFTQCKDDHNRRGLGWDKPGQFFGVDNTSKYASEQAFGHTGFTGTAIWIDPVYELIYIFLSNRVYPEATNVALQELNIRTKIHDIVYEAIMR